MQPKNAERKMRTPYIRNVFNTQVHRNIHEQSKQRNRERRWAHDLLRIGEASILCVFTLSMHVMLGRSIVMLHLLITLTIYQIQLTS